ncbi:unnamed protein product [Ostreobium quekettii]|uniref:Condensin complex subunit 1 C-terminal domain-containing protein n=1 Tax=Ostreobium quekettii TaxID=121088 RepID=A0A8S1JFB0_9CHLO|nr:unnamed protein product [Ostreobium quekettii]|eukprot:evm.model.scf_219.4 EVM.evm.TU.scf_219.4   scf_219:25780-46436(-)
MDSPNPAALLTRLADACASHGLPDAPQDGGSGDSARGILASVPIDAEAALAVAAMAGDAAAGARLSKDCSESGTSLSLASRSLCALVLGAKRPQGLAAGAVYVSLLVLPGSPVFELLDISTLLALLKLLRNEPSTPSRGDPSSPSPSPSLSPALAADFDPQDFDRICCSIISCLTTLVETVSLKEHEELLEVLIDAMAMLVLSPAGRPSCGRRAQDDSLGTIGESALTLLHGCINALNGPVYQLAGRVFKRLASCLMGVQAGSGVADGNRDASASVRPRIMQFVLDVHSQKPDCLPAVAALARHLSLHAPDKAQQRDVAVNSAATLVAAFPPSVRWDFMCFLYQLSRVAKIQHRTVAVRLCEALLLGNDDIFDVQEDQNVSCGCVCLAILMQRMNDKSAGVRGRAIGNMATVVDHFIATVRTSTTATQASVLQSAMSAAQSLKLEILDVTAGEDRQQSATNVADGQDVSEQQSGHHGPRLVAHVSTTGLLLDGLCNAALLHVGDEKSSVRKASLQLTEAIIVLMRLFAPGGDGADFPVPEQPIQAIEAAMGDSLLTVRRAALTASSRLMTEFPLHQPVCSLWVRAALPLVHDPETSIRDSATDSFHSNFILPAQAVGCASDPPGPTAEEKAGVLRPILNAIAGTASSVSCLGVACKMSKTKGLLRADKVARGAELVIDGLGSSTEDESLAVEGAWHLLRAVAAQDPRAPSWQFLQRHWEQSSGTATAPANVHSGITTALLLQVMANAAEAFPVEMVPHLAKQLLEGLLTFSLDPAAAGAHALALRKLTGRVTCDAANGLLGWADHARDRCQSIVEEYISQAPHQGGCQHRGNRQQVISALFTAGEVAMLCRCRIPQRLVTVVMTVTEPKLMPRPSPTDSAPTVGQIRGQASGALSSQMGAECLVVPGDVRCHAWTALGKFCLLDERMAKKMVPRMVQEFLQAGNPAIRNNIAVILSDLCIEHTALIDAHVPTLAKSISDPHPLVRYQSLGLLFKLLQKDYIRWRGPVVVRILLALVDPEARNRATAEYIVADAVATKAPLLAYNYFHEVLFVLNGCRSGLQGELASALGGLSDEEAVQAGIRGSDKKARSRRDTIYATLLRHMRPEHKFATAAKLCKEVLAGVADKVLLLDDVEEVLGDAMRILASKEIKVKVNASGSEDEDLDGPEAGSQGSLSQKARGKAVSELMRRHLLEAVVPVMIALKCVLNSRQHPLIADFMLCLRSMLSDHKNEIKDILVADKQLATEILYDLKQAEQAKLSMSSNDANRRSMTTPGQRTHSPAVESTKLLPIGAMPDTPGAVEVLNQGPVQASPVGASPMGSGGCKTPLQQLMGTPNPVLTPGAQTARASEGLAVLASCGPETVRDVLRRLLEATTAAELHFVKVFSSKLLAGKAVKPIGETEVVIDARGVLRKEDAAVVVALVAAGAFDSDARLLVDGHIRFLGGGGEGCTPNAKTNGLPQTPGGHSPLGTMSVPRLKRQKSPRSSIPPAVSLKEVEQDRQPTPAIVQSPSDHMDIDDTQPVVCNVTFTTHDMHGVVVYVLSTVPLLRLEGCPSLSRRDVEIIPFGFNPFHNGKFNRCIVCCAIFSEHCFYVAPQKRLL